MDAMEYALDSFGLPEDDADLLIICDRCETPFAAGDRAYEINGETLCEECVDEKYGVWI